MGQTLREEFAQWLRGHLRSQGWMVSDFAERVGVRPSAVYRWTAGQRTPTDVQVDKIADVLQIPSEEIWQALARAGVRPISPSKAAAPRVARPASSAPAAPPAERPFAQWLRGQLADRGWSTGFLARKMELDPVTVRAWLNGVRDPATVQFPRIAGALDVDEDVLRGLIES